MADKGLEKHVVVGIIVGESAGVFVDRALCVPKIRALQRQCGQLRQAGTETYTAKVAARQAALAKRTKGPLARRRGIE